MNWNKRDTVRTVIILCGVVLFAFGWALDRKYRTV